MPFRRKKKKTLTKKIQGFTRISPLVILALNLLVIGTLWLLLPERLTAPRWVMLFICGLALNGWLMWGIFFTYYLRDQSDRFLSPVFNAPLGERQGFLTVVPPIIKEGKMIEPEYTIRAVGGFEAMFIYMPGKVITAYPTKYEVHMAAGGIACYCWLRSCKIDQVAPNVRNWLVRVGASKGIYIDGDTEIWFARSIFDVGETVPDAEKNYWDYAMEEKDAEIQYLKGQRGEYKYQVESNIMGDSLEAAKRRPADEDFRTRYNEPPETVAERASRETDYEDQRKRDRERRTQW